MLFKLLGAMTGHSRDITDYLPLFAQELRKRGTPQEEIVRFLRYCDAIHPATLGPPCPYCFVAGKVVSMASLPEPVEVRRFKCAGCNEELLVPRAEERHEPAGGDK